MCGHDWCSVRISKEIVEFASHDDLMAARGFYYALYMSQFKGKAPGSEEDIEMLLDDNRRPGVANPLSDDKTTNHPVSCPPSRPLWRYRRGRVCLLDRTRRVHRGDRCPRAGLRRRDRRGAAAPIGLVQRCFATRTFVL